LNRDDIRDFRDGVSDQYHLDYTYPLSKRTLLYVAAGYTKIGGDVHLNSARNGFSGRKVETGIRHTFWTSGSRSRSGTNVVDAHQPKNCHVFMTPNTDDVDQREGADLLICGWRAGVEPIDKANPAL
jgi:hypothetical protein